MIRQAAVDDLKQIVEGYREHFAYERTHTAYTVFREGVYPIGEDAEKAIRSGAMYVYEENGIVQGSMILDGEQPEEYRKIAWTNGYQIVAAASMRVGGMICHSRHLFLEKELAL